MVKCPKGTIKNPETQNCVLIDGRVGKRILLERKLKRSPSSKSPRRRSDKKCPKGTIKNPETEKCVLIDGRVGKRILLERKLKRSPSSKSPRRRSDKKCPKGKIKNPETEKCVLIDGRVGKSILLERKLKRSSSSKSPRRRSDKKCPKGTIKNPETQNCVLVDGKVGKRILLERKLQRSASSPNPINKKCPSGTIFEKNTKDCVLIEGKLGKSILLEKKLKELESRGNKKHPSDLIWNSETKKWVLIDGRVGKSILLQKTLMSNSSASISTSSSTFPSESISTSSSSVPLTSSSYTSLSDDSLSPLPTPMMYNNRLPPRPPPLTIRQPPLTIRLPPRTPIGQPPLTIRLPPRPPIGQHPLTIRQPVEHPLQSSPAPIIQESRLRSSLPSTRSPSPAPRIQESRLRSSSQFTRSPSPAPRIQTKTVRWDRLPPKEPSPSLFVRSPSPSRLPTRIEPIEYLPPPTIPEINNDEYFPEGPAIRNPIRLDSVGEDCKYLKEWKKGKMTGSGEVGETVIVTYKKNKKNNYEYVLKSQKRDTKFKSEFRAEIQALIELQGTDLVPKIYDVWTCNTMGYIIMEKLYQCDHIHPQELYEKVGAKLRSLRARGWLHVDTHDGNVMCTDEGEPVIIDFGYAVKRKDGGDNETYPEHPKSLAVAKGGWGVALPWKFLEVMQEVNFHESFNPYGSKDRKIRRLATRQNEIDYKNMQKKYQDAQEKLRIENDYRHGVMLDEMSKYERLYMVRNLNK